jgi:hypothetical protein
MVTKGKIKIWRRAHLASIPSQGEKRLSDQASSASPFRKIENGRVFGNNEQINRACRAQIK